MNSLGFTEPAVVPVHICVPRLGCDSTCFVSDGWRDRHTKCQNEEDAIHDGVHHDRYDDGLSQEELKNQTKV
jgi:hypothetical protein